jgi:membrane-bound metal-dependent hydrolase YbcI (DUF457 family)
VLGRTHALSGAALFLAVAPWLGEFTPIGIPEMMVGAVVTAGTAMLPDLDHPSSSVARTFGWPTMLLSKGVSRLAGGHRKATHGLLFCGLAGVLAGAAVATGPVGQAVVVTLALGLGLRALGFTRGGVVANLGTFAVCGAAAIAAAASLNLAWLPAAYALGCLAHLAGDLCTESGVPLLWPLPAKLRVATIDTGGAVEKRLVAPLLIVAMALLVAHHLGLWPEAATISASR